ncbi:MAG: hypothetical protein MUF80_05995, partial [Burkholderiales bacterium]|nr:hypothetical protein [Burkholderiales bacterium]
MAKPWEQDWSVLPTAPTGATARPPWEQDWSVEDRATEERGPLRAAGDVGLEVVSGGLKGIKFISDAFGADNPASRGLGAADDFVKSLQSEQAQAEDRRIGEIMRAAEDQGALEQVKAALSAAGEAPVRQSLGALATGLPVIAASFVPGLREASWGARLAALGTMGAVQGAGVVKSSIYDGVYERAREEGRSEAGARALAEQAQAYGENPGLIAGGAGLGAAASVTGFQPAIAHAISRAGAQTTAKAAGSTLVKEVGKGVLKEAPLEALQGGQEQY